MVLLLSPYNVQCMYGHVFSPLVGSDLEARCRKHEAAGYLDALVLGSMECNRCQQEREDQAERDARMCSLAGCALNDGTCESKGCVFLRN